MFEVGFSELLLIFALALIVLGPERLPKVAAQVGRWIGRARSIARQFREQLEEEINLEEQKSTRPRTGASAGAATAAGAAAAGATADAATAPAEPPPDASTDTSQANHPWGGQDVSGIPYADAGTPVFADPAPAAPGTTVASAEADLTPAPAAAPTDPDRAHERGT